MAGSDYFRNLLLTLLLGFLFFATQVISYRDPRVADVGKRNGDRTALPAPGPGLAIRGVEDKKSLVKRVDLVAVWNSLPATRRVGTNTIRDFDLPADQVISYGATYCYGCVVVVVGSGEKLVIAHLPEETGAQNNWKDDTSDTVFMNNILAPLEDALEASGAKLGSAPNVMIFGPTPVRNGDLSNRKKINELIELIKSQFCALQDSDIAQYGYVKATSFSESAQTVDGKVTVNWVGPKDGQGVAELLVWAETTEKIHAFYQCESGECLWSIVT